MISKIKISSFVLFLSIFAMFISFGQQKAEWKGKIEYDNGIKIVKNPSEADKKDDSSREKKAIRCEIIRHKAT